MSITDNPNPVVVIPTHKALPSAEEIFSLKQCNKVLGLRELYLMIPKGLNTDVYREILPTSKIYEVPSECMASHLAYNQLMISPRIYRKFENYSHILIHEPDSIVIRDDLDFWCSQNFDYIGAPWFQKNSNGLHRLHKTGNFGFSLLNTKSINQIFHENLRWYSPSMILRDIFRGLRGKKNSFQKALNGIQIAGKVSGASYLYQEHCDIFWSQLIPKLNPRFRIAPPEQAVKFAWEACLHDCARINQNKLPFGIHAWGKHDQNFLRPLLESAGIFFDETVLTHAKNKS